MRDLLFERYLANDVLFEIAEEDVTERASDARAIALITFGVMLGWGLIGGLIYPFYRAGTPSHLSESDVDQAEDEDELIDHGPDPPAEKA